MKNVNFLTKAILSGIVLLSFVTTGYAQLSGSYTIGGSSPDYVDLEAAVNDLNSSGVSGPVVFNIRSGSYPDQVTIGSITGASNANRITIQSETNNPNDVTISFAPTSTTNNFIIRLDDASYITIKDVTVTTTATARGRLIELLDKASYNRIENCVLDAVGTDSDMSCIYAASCKGTDNTIIGNVLRNGYYGIYLRGTSTSMANMTKNTVIENNTYDDVFYYSNYIYYQHNMKFRNNTITKTSNGTHYAARLYYCNNGLEFDNNTITLDGTGTRYGIYGYYNDGKMTISNNKITITSTGTKYGMRLYYNDGTSANNGIVINNSIALDCGSSTGYGIYSYNSKYQNYINNSVSVNSTSATGVAGRFGYSSSSYTNNNIYNNVFCNVTGSGYAMYVDEVNAAYNNAWDYNNIHSGTSKLVELGSPATNFTTLAAWVIASKQDAHSISYNPGFTGLTDLTPDASNPASWSLNGRALQIPSNVSDVNNNIRPDAIAVGVPDIGAYEFTPTVLPPLATATPATANPGDVQVFTFGQREVATIKWSATSLVDPLDIRQYSGVKAPGIVAAAAPSGTMFFYTNIVPQGSVSTFDYEIELNYMDIWMGDVGAENELRLAHEVSSYPWMVYNNGLSTVNVASNVINANKMSGFGSFTGLGNGSILSAFVRPQGKTVICVGNSVLLNAEPQTGDSYKWYYNGTEIGGANNKTYNATQAGQYAVEITYGNKVIESIPVVVSTIAPPNAVIVANGTLTYCIGNGLVLNAGNITGVTYQWQLDGVNIPGANNNVYPVNQAGNYTVLVENVGCATVSTNTTVAAGPLSVSLGIDTTYCEIKNVWHKLDAGYPGAAYTWSTGETTQTIEVKQQGRYWVRVDAGPNCIADDTINVTIDQLPQANGISFVQNGNTYQFYPSGPIGVSGFLWLFSDGTTSISSNPTKTITGDLYVRLVLFNGCGTDTVQLGWPLTIDNTVKEDGVVIFPNPASDNISIRMDGAATLQEITILNSIGAIVGQHNNLDGKQMQTINVAQLPAGQYMLRARTTEGAINRQFSIIR